MNRAFIVGAVVATFGVLALPPVDAAAVHIHIANFAFDPVAPTIQLGDTVTWDNHDGAPHTATDRNCPRAGGPGPCLFDTLALDNAESFTSAAFSAAGLIDYLCTIHGFTGSLLIDDPLLFADFRVQEVKIRDLGYQTKTLEVTVINDGNEPAGGTRLFLGYQYQGGLKTIKEFDVRALRVGETQTFTTTWQANLLVGDFVVEARSDHTALVEESDEGNNVLTKLTTFIIPTSPVPGLDPFDPI